MAKNALQRASGHITMVQEQRFRLFTSTGRGLLLTLSHKASLRGEDLQRLHKEHTPVQVVYEGPPNLATGVALAISEADSGVSH